ncbi:glycosyltransferase [Candidatus Woesearchaeota archaeon]|nr:glycosyltransferase [Candidatus Woesearchaeota archaeon]
MRQKDTEEDIMELTVVIPALNEEKGIKDTVEKIKEYVPAAHVMVVDDGSDDKTAMVAEKLGAEVVRHAKNKGYGAALITGFSYSKTPFVAFLDADLTYHPRYIPQLLKLVKSKELDCAWGNRFGTSNNRMPFVRKIGNRMLVLLFFIMTGKNIKDASCGERVFRKQSLEKIDYETLPPGLDMITAMSKRIVKRKLRYEIIPIEYEKRSGSSKLNVVKDFLRMTRNILFER